MTSGVRAYGAYEWVGGALLGAIVTSAAVVGCAGSSANAPPANGAPAASAEDEHVSAGLIEHHRYHHHGGVTLFIALSLDTLGTAPERRAAVEKIRADLHERMEPARVAEQNVVLALSDGLAAGNIDTAKVDAAVAQSTAAAAAVYDASVDAMNELHGVLAPMERAALIDKVESHWAVWQKANADETGSTAEEERKQSGHLATLQTELGLSDDQVTQIRARLLAGMQSMPHLDPAEVTAHLRVFGDAFRSDKFDARVFAHAGGANERLAHWGASRMAHFVEAVSPVLTPEQRAAFAEQLRMHATHDPSAQANR